MKKPKAEWSLKSVISDCETSDFRQTDISSRYRESVYTFEITDVVNGKISTFITPDMEVSRMDIVSKKDLVAFQGDDMERCVSTFMFKGNIFSDFADINTTLQQNKQQHSFVHICTEESKHTISAGCTSVMYINLKPTLLHSFIPLWEQYEDKLYEKSNYRKFYSSPAFQVRQNSRMQQILLSLYADTFDGITRSLFIEAKSMELLALQLNELLQQTESTSSKTLAITKADYEKLVAMHDYITENYLQPLSLSSLVKQFTLNEFKLKKGFKQLYNQSTFNYILTLRMQHAQTLLQSGGMTVDEVSDLVGYSSIHNFSNAFYKMYNYRPNMSKTAGLSVYNY